MPADHDLDDLLDGIVAGHQRLDARVADLEKIELQQNIHPSIHLQLPQLRGYWPMSSVDENNDVYDLSGQGRVLTNVGFPPTTFSWENLLPYAEFTPGSNQYLSRADETGLDITGALTVGGWFYLNTLAPGNNMGLISKFTSAGNQRSYMLYFVDATNEIRFGVSSNGVNWVSVGAGAVAASTWYHVVGKYTPSTQLSIYLDGVETTNIVGIPASIFNSTANFLIGSYDAGSFLLDGRAGQCYLCADDHDDAIILDLYNRTRANFGK